MAAAPPPLGNDNIQEPIMIPVMPDLRERTFHDRATMVTQIVSGDQPTEEQVAAVKNVLANTWLDRLMEIKDTVLRNDALMVGDKAFWETWGGFYYSHHLERCRVIRARDHRLTRTDGTEIAPSDPNYDQLINHYEADLAMADPELRGPIILDDWRLRENMYYLRYNITSVIIGICSLVFLPLRGGNVLNMGLFDVDNNTVSYRPYPCRRPLRGPENSNFFDHVWQRLRLIGLKSSHPVFLEFFLPMAWASGTLWDYVIGFFYYTVRMQMAYAGPIIIVQGPTWYKGTQETVENYNRRKRFAEKVGKLLRAAGLALGVPVWEFFVQNRQHGSSRYFVEQTYFTPFPLYTSTGEPTLELNRRLSSEFNQIHQKVESIVIPAAAMRVN